jgi:uncharacterized protein (TIGR02757 family)
MEAKKLKEFLDKKVDQYNRPSFIKDDPICIPHFFSKKQDIEISGFFAAAFAWGNRTTIINKSKELFALMDNAPYDFIRNHRESDLKNFLSFKHRTFNTTDLLYFIQFLQRHYQQFDSLEKAFTKHIDRRLDQEPVEQALIHFHHNFFSLPDAPLRTKKHIATPEKNSNCKRLNMYLRWMVRKDKHGVDFGLWKEIKMSELICPVDVHVARVAKRFNILHQKQVNWSAALELTHYLRTLDTKDPARYDFALFALGALEKYS